MNIMEDIFGSLPTLAWEKNWDDIPKDKAGIYKCTTAQTINCFINPDTLSTSTCYTFINLYNNNKAMLLGIPTDDMGIVGNWSFVDGMRSSTWNLIPTSVQLYHLLTEYNFEAINTRSITIQDKDQGNTTRIAPEGMITPSVNFGSPVQTITSDVNGINVKSFTTFDDSIKVNNKIYVNSLNNIQYNGKALASVFYYTIKGTNTSGLTGHIEFNIFARDDWTNTVIETSLISYLQDVGPIPVHGYCTDNDEISISRTVCFLFSEENKLRATYIDGTTRRPEHTTLSNWNWIIKRKSQLIQISI